MEKTFTRKEYATSLLKSYLKQYINIINTNNLEAMPILLAGGVPQKLPVIREHLEKQEKLITGNPIPIDETLIGLNKITSLISIEDKNDKSF